MSTDADDNLFPFADCELEITSDVDRPKIKIKTISNDSIKPASVPRWNRKSYVYFENTMENSNYVTLIPYIGPSNTLHLNRNLYLPQLTSKENSKSTISFEQFTEEYDQVLTSLETMSFSVYLRFGISYIIRAPDYFINEKFSLQDFMFHRNHGRELKTSFYTCKGVTSPKHLISTIMKQNYEQISSNIYSYEIQIYGTKTSSYPQIHFQYDEQLKCTSIYYLPDNLINFDFIRDKSSSRFRSIDDSYADIFDFRIQIRQEKKLTKTDQDVLHTLRGVPIDEVLFIDKSTHAMYVTRKLQKYVKYLKCIRSNNYQNFHEQILISIGTYDEYQLNSHGQCELSMKASNTMTIECLNLGMISNAKKPFETGMWFSNLCQTCVQLPTPQTLKKQSVKWFSSVLRKTTNQSIKAMDVNQLTTYKTQKSEQMYTNQELKFVKKILQEENLREIFVDSNDEENINDQTTLNEKYQAIKNRLETSKVPLANKALKKVERAYKLVSQEFV